MKKRLLALMTAALAVLLGGQVFVPRNTPLLQGPIVVPEAELRKKANTVMDGCKDSKGCDNLHLASKEVDRPQEAYWVAARAADGASHKRFDQSASVFLH